MAIVTDVRVTIFSANELLSAFKKEKITFEFNDICLLNYPSPVVCICLIFFLKFKEIIVCINRAEIP